MDSSTTTKSTSEKGGNGGGGLSTTPPPHRNIYSNILATSSILNSSSDSNQNNHNNNCNNKNEMLEVKKSMISRRGSEHFEFIEPTSIFSPASIMNGTNTFYNSSSEAYEYETITTSVPESLAQKIIAEARAAGITHRAGS